MGIDLCTYRHRIGQFQFSSKSKCSKKMKLTKFRPTNISSAMSILLLLLCSNTLLFQDTSQLSLISSMSSRSSSPTLPSTSMRYTMPAVVGTTEQFSTAGLSGFHSVKLNKACHILYGNRRNLGYRLAEWNCARGLLTCHSEDSDKLVDIKHFIETHKPHLMGIIEADIHRPNSNAGRTNTFTTQQIHDKLKVEGYSIILPKSWSTHDQARILVYVSDAIKVVKKDIDDDDLPSITLEIGLGRERKTTVNYYYREWTGGVSGDDSHGGQVERLNRQVHLWRSLANQDRDVVLLGDANLCALSWNDADYPADKKVLANLIHDFNLEQTFVQVVERYTRTELRGNSIQKGCLDHISTNSPGKCEASEVLAGGNSDHLAVMIVKRSKEIKTKPEVVRKRSYKNFNKDNFLREVKFTSFDSVLEEADPSKAAEELSKIFGKILDNHAPVKIFQTRKHYAPWLSDEIKEMIVKRNQLKVESIVSSDPETQKELKRLRNRIKTLLKTEKVP